jgi:hypothetical protein
VSERKPEVTPEPADDDGSVRRRLVRADDGRMIPGPQFMAEAVAAAKAGNQARQRAIRAALDPAIADKGGKSRLGRTTEYGRVVKRRYRERQRGLDPDMLGSDYRLPTRESRATVRDQPALLRSLAVLGLDPDLADALDD